MTKNQPEKKRGPKPDYLKIDEDPGEALDRLLGVDRKSEADEDEDDEQAEDNENGSSEKGGSA